jgi:Family of unknown function (DUF6375)
MKIWYGQGSEHSMNLVMIGHFKDVATASEAKEIIDQLTQQVEADRQAGLIEIGEHSDRFTDGTLNLLQKVRVHILSPCEMDQFGYDVNLRVDDSKVVLTTDESDVSAFLKVLIDKGARVEVYSAHSHEGTGYGRPT